MVKYMIKSFLIALLCLCANSNAQTNNALLLDPLMTMQQPMESVKTFSVTWDPTGLLVCAGDLLTAQIITFPPCEYFISMYVDLYHWRGNTQLYTWTTPMVQVNGVWTGYRAVPMTAQPYDVLEYCVKVWCSVPDEVFSKCQSYIVM